MVRDRNPIFHIAYVQIFIQQNPSSVQIVLFMKCVISTRKNSNIFNWIRLRVRMQWNSERERKKNVYTTVHILILIAPSQVNAIDLPTVR